MGVPRAAACNGRGDVNFGPTSPVIERSQSGPHEAQTRGHPPCAADQPTVTALSPLLPITSSA